MEHARSPSEPWPPLKPAYRPLPADPGYDPPRPDRWLMRCEHLSADLGRFEEALAALDQEPSLQNRLRRICMPHAYRTDEEIDVWRARFLEELDRFSSSGFDPQEAYAALGYFNTFAVAYQNRDVRPLLEPLGRFLVERIGTPALPDLSEAIEPRPREGKLKVGYISANLRGNQASRWAQGWAANHSDEIETYAFHLAAESDAGTTQWADTVNHFYHIPRRYPAAARFIKDLELDALIYTDLGMDGRAYQFACLRLAPVQCTAWGHPVTSGLPTIDFYISSELMEPEGADEHYSEQLVRLPGTGQCWRRFEPELSQRTREEFGLPTKGPLILMCHNTMKCLPCFDRLYQEIGERLGAPIVLVESVTRGSDEVLKERFAALKIKTHWLRRIRNGNDYYRLLQLADVTLDPPEWSGGNTVVETLLMGSPVITMRGRFMRGNLAAAFNQVAGAPGLIASDPDDYVDLACDFERQKRAMAGLNVDALFEDKRPVQALDEFLMGRLR
ncbi:MAG: hypothetical protein HYR64_03120 [Fimbriimonas ginsengisoli]|uniref:O-GlcNAc transferase C-terminal domain-containing protein n=1 Tax=Fimbriimonas ginsengisoli TaxID=1005039 RepID=A0A931LRN9_FIMGI|nr:hypothetical protein [Fimbriimonas ginsengisoli]